MAEFQSRFGIVAFWFGQELIKDKAKIIEKRYEYQIHLKDELENYTVQYSVPKNRVLIQWLPEKGHGIK